LGSLAHRVVPAPWPLEGLAG